MPSKNSNHHYTSRLEDIGLHDVKYCVHTIRNKYLRMNSKSKRKWDKWLVNVETFLKESNSSTKKINYQKVP